MPRAASLTAPAQHNPALDGLRGFAVLLIYLFHYGGGLTSHNPIIRFFGDITASGWVGVQLFFTLSGFLITGILWRSQNLQPELPHRLRNFYLRRILRIAPLYYIVLLIVAVALFANARSSGNIRFLLPEILFLQDIPYLSAQIEQLCPLPLFHLWSLAVEEQFYLLWPLLLLLCRTRRAALTLCGITFTLSLAFAIGSHGFPHLISDATAKSFDRFLLTNAGALALGSFLAIALEVPIPDALTRTIHRYATPTLLFALAIFIASSLHNQTFTLNTRSQYLIAFPAMWLACAALIPLLLRPGRAHNAASLTPLRFLGRISYGFYLLHIFLEPLFDRLGTRLTHTTAGYSYQLTRLFLAFPITLAIAWVSYQLVEFPILRLKLHFPLAHPKI